MTERDAPRRVLVGRDAFCVVVGAIIGVGIFFTPSNVARLAGSADLALLSWAVGGAVALLGALCFAELGGLYPRAGGQYPVLRDAFGAPVAFTYGFCLVTAIQSGATAIIGIICARHLGVALDGRPPGPALTLVLATLLIAGLSLANVRGTRQGARIQNFTVYAKLATLLLVGLLAVLGESTPTAAPPGAAPPPDTLDVLVITLSPVLFSFGGWQQGLWMAGEVKDAGRVVPRAIIGGVIVVVVVYLLMNWACFRLLGFQGVTGSRALAADAVETVLGGGWSRVVAGAVAISAFGVMNAQLLTGPRYLWAMAHDGRFIAFFDHLHGRFGTPARAIVLLAVVSCALLWVAGESGVDQILTGVVLVDWVYFGLTGAALVVLRVRRPEAERPVRVPAYPVTPLLFVGAAGVAVAGSFLAADRRLAAWIAVGWIAAAAFVYLLLFGLPGNRDADS